MVFIENNIMIEDEMIENAADMAIAAIAKAIPEKSLCIAIIEIILERAAQRVKTITIASFQQYLEENKK